MPFQTNPQKLSHTLSQSPLRCQKVSLGLWPCHAFPSVAFLALRRLHWYRDLVWEFSQLGCLLEALWPCEFLIHPTAHHVCAGTAASSRPKTQQQALRAGLRRIACPISLSPSTGTSPVDTLIAIWTASMQSTSVELQYLKSDLNHYRLTEKVSCLLCCSYVLLKRKFVFLLHFCFCKECSFQTVFVIAAVLNLFDSKTSSL